VQVLALLRRPLRDGGPALRRAAGTAPAGVAGRAAPPLLCDRAGEDWHSAAHNDALCPPFTSHGASIAHPRLSFSRPLRGRLPIMGSIAQSELAEISLRFHELLCDPPSSPPVLSAGVGGSCIHTHSQANALSIVGVPDAAARLQVRQVHEGWHDAGTACSDFPYVFLLVSC
jgi:hypothetical protein